MRKTILTFLSLIITLSMLLAACAPATQAPAADSGADTASDGDAAGAASAAENGEQIELRIAWWGSQDRHDRTIKVIEMYEELHPEIDIVYEFSGWEDHWTKMATQAAGNNLPDIMQQDYARLEEWVSRDLLLPLDDYVDSGMLDFSNVTEAELEGGRIDGVLYAVNLGTNSQTFVLDVDAFEQAGIELPEQDWTWEEFEQIITQLHEGLDIWGMGPGLTGEQMWKSLYLGHGQWSYNDEGTGLGYEDDQIFANYLEMVMRLQEAGVIPSREEEVARFDGQGVEALPMVTNEAAVEYFWSNQIVAVQTAAGEDRNFILTHLPRPEGGQPSNYVKPSQFFSITSQARYPDEAAAFIDFFTNNIEANEILLAERGVPISSEVREALTPLLGKAQLEMFEYLERVTNDSSPIRPPDPVGHADITNNVYMAQVIDPFRYGQITSAEAVEILRQEASPILEANAE